MLEKNYVFNLAVIWSSQPTYRNKRLCVCCTSLMYNNLFARNFARLNKFKHSRTDLLSFSQCVRTFMISQTAVVSLSCPCLSIVSVSNRHLNPDLNNWLEFYVCVSITRWHVGTLARGKIVTKPYLLVKRTLLDVLKNLNRSALKSEWWVPRLQGTREECGGWMTCFMLINFAFTLASTIGCILKMTRSEIPPRSNALGVIVLL